MASERENFVGIMFLIVAAASIYVFVAGAFSHQLVACAIVAAAWVYGCVHA